MFTYVFISYSCSDQLLSDGRRLMCPVGFHIFIFVNLSNCLRKALAASLPHASSCGKRAPYVDVITRLNAETPYV